MTLTYDVMFFYPQVTPPHMVDLVYCARHANIRTVRKMMVQLERFAQDLDGECPILVGPSRFELLKIVLHVHLLMSTHFYYTFYPNLCVNM